MIDEEAMQDRELSKRSRIDSGMNPPPKREQIASWTVAALQIILTQTVRNSWRHRHFDWFPKDPAEPQVKNFNDKIMRALPCMAFMAMIKALV